MSTRRSTAAANRPPLPSPHTSTDAPSRTPAQPPQSPPRTPQPGPAATDGAPLSTALAMASFRISHGNPTPEETAAVAAVLVAGLRRLHDTGPATAGPRILRLPHRTRPTYRAPGSWAS